MRIIDLLNKIANGEEVPKVIKYHDKIYNYEEFNIGYGKDYFNAEWKIEKGYRHTTSNNSYIYLNINDYHLNDEVEIIEDEPRDIEVCGSLFTRSEYNKLAGIKEDKKIEKLKLYAPYPECSETRFDDIQDKINEIIDYLEENK